MVLPNAQAFDMHKQSHIEQKMANTAVVSLDVPPAAPKDKKKEKKKNKTKDEVVTPSVASVGPPQERKATAHATTTGKSGGGGGPFVCFSCKKVFPSSVTLDSHLQATKHYGMVCLCCDASFSVKSQLGEHWDNFQGHKSEHFVNLQKITSATTSSSVEVPSPSSSSSSTSSTPGVPSSSFKPRLCSFCAVTFDSNASRKAHMKMMHTNKKDGPFTCFICNTIFETKDQLKAHILTPHVSSSV
eukprot:TRINITY_DN30972_c0_g1_i1.p1 TRINITY_DN30972_c0_g1~~TRINITY_DN30972_c0_g1_i1.p1  ORF type:complete len:243 (-),score=44.84 TRINITY_DN30972_c0_g1_i1:76-804(-)